MSERVHAPGPWLQRGLVAPGEKSRERAVVVDFEGIPVAHALGPAGPYPRPPGEVNANARLIAAAPDMLAALTEMVEMGEGCVTGSNCRDPECCRYGRARAALAKAEGKTP